MTIFVKKKVSELEGSQLDWAVFHADPYKAGFTYTNKALLLPSYKPSINWLQGGPILETMLKSGKWGIEPWNTPANSIIVSNTNNECIPYDGDFNKNEINSVGRTILEAAMRAFVMDKLGNEVEVPV